MQGTLCLPLHWVLRGCWWGLFNTAHAACLALLLLLLLAWFQVAEGLELLEQLNEVLVDDDNRPLQNIWWGTLHCLLQPIMPALAGP